LDREVSYIFSRLFSLKDRTTLHNDVRVLGAIRKILSHIREANLDVPFVAINRSYDYLSEGLT
jgi:hypothetical protein